MNVSLNIGIVGSGYIADVIASIIRDSRCANVVAVCSRNLDNAKAFADKYGGLQVFEGWDELVAWPGLDAVYVATPTSIRESVCVAAVRNKKHLLAEKPFANLASLKRITQACRDNSVAFMDATHFVHHPRSQQLKRELEERIGRLQAVNTSFFFPSMERSNIRHNPDLEPTGAIGDMAWYCMRAVTEFVTQGTSVVSASGFAQKDKISQAIVRGSGVLLLSDGCTSTWNAGFNTGACLMDLDLYGEWGVISLDDFVLDWADSFAVKTPGYPVGFCQRSGVVSPAGFNKITTPCNEPQIVSMFKNFTALTMDPKAEAAQKSMLISERTQGLLDVVWEQLIIIGDE